MQVKVDMIGWKLITVLTLLGSCMGQGDCADPELLFISSRDDAEANGVKNLRPSRPHKKKHAHRKKSRTPKHKRSKAKNALRSLTKTEKLLENYAVEGECNRLACSSNIHRAKSCLKTKKRRNHHKKCFRAFCQYGCNDTDYHARREVFDLCNSICSSRKYQKRQDKR